MPSRKIFVVGQSTTYANWMCGSVTTNMNEADLVVFPGGPDVNPALYGETAVHSLTRMDDRLDLFEIECYKRARDMGKKIVGICRGGQLMCAMAGGKLVQHQSDRNSHHPIFTYDGTIITVSSSHHQAMYPWLLPDDKYQVLGWSIGESDWHLNGLYQEMVKDKVPLNMEVEIAYFNEINALCIQGHPEWQYPQRDAVKHNKDAISWLRMVLNHFMDGHQFKEARDAYGIKV